MALGMIFLLLFWHWVADFTLQTSWQAENKSKKNAALLAHTVTYSIFFLIVIYIFEGNKPLESLYFALITFVAHTVTDYFTSRLNTYLWNKKQVHNFFVSVGFDQLLHYAQLILTYNYLFPTPLNG